MPVSIPSHLNTYSTRRSSVQISTAFKRWTLKLCLYSLPRPKFSRVPDGSTGFAVELLYMIFKRLTSEMFRWAVVVQGLRGHWLSGGQAFWMIQRRNSLNILSVIPWSLKVFTNIEYYSSYPRAWNVTFVNSYYCYYFATSTYVASTNWNSQDIENIRIGINIQRQGYRIWVWTTS